MRNLGSEAWALLGIVAGCAVYTSGIRPDASLDPGSAYLYGRFFMNARANEAEFGGKQSIGLVIRCQDGSSYTFGSLDKQQLQVLRIKPPAAPDSASRTEAKRARRWHAWSAVTPTRTVRTG